MTDFTGVDVAGWDKEFARLRSPTFDAIWRRSITNAYPADVDALTIWPTWDLTSIAELLDVSGGRTLADIGCGGAHPGLWVARHTGARYVGVDPSLVALERAGATAGTFLEQSRFRFVQGHYGDTGLEDASTDAIVSFDSFHFVSDPEPAPTELVRVMRRGARLVMVHAQSVDSHGAPVPQYRAAFAAAGLAILALDETPDQRVRLERAWSAVIESADVIAKEMQGEPANELVDAGDDQAYPRRRRATAVRLEQAEDAVARDLGGDDRREPARVDRWRDFDEVDRNDVQSREIEECLAKFFVRWATWFRCSCSGQDARIQHVEIDAQEHGRAGRNGAHRRRQLDGIGEDREELLGIVVFVAAPRSDAQHSSRTRQRHVTRSARMAPLRAVVFGA